MKFVHEQIKSTSFEDYVARQSRVKKLRNLFIALGVSMQVLTIGLISKIYFIGQIGMGFFITYTLNELIKVILDMYILKIMFQYFIFIVRKRIALHKKLGTPQPLKIKVFMAWITLVLFLMAFNMTFFHVMSIYVPLAHS